MRARCCFVLLLSAVPLFQAKGQLPAMPVFQQKALLAFSPAGTLPLSFSLTGSATWTAGSLKDSGTLQMQIAADGSTSETWALKTISRSYEQTLSNAGRSCQSTDAKGKTQADFSAMCQQPIPWFAPWFALKTVSTGEISVNDATNATDSSANLERLTYTLAYPDLSKLKTKALTELARFQQATAVTVFYDSQTALPTRLEYKQTTDSEESRALDISIRFSDFRQESGFMIPHHIERFVQRTLQLDYLVTGVTVK